MCRLTLIVAATRTNGIGKHGVLPWHLPQEMKYFSRATSVAPEGAINIVVMGRNTWESIPIRHRPLKGRENVVVSRNEEYKLTPFATPVMAHLCNSLESVLKQLSETTFSKPIHRTFIIGGASLYKETLQLPISTPSDTVALVPAFVDRILMTRILEPGFEDCDTFMPDFEHSPGGGGRAAAWKKAAHEELERWVGFTVPQCQEENGVRYEFQMWVRIIE